MRIHINGRPVGDGAPCHVVAEIGSNHDRELATARRMIEIAAECGADSVKFQTFEAKRLYPRGAGKSDYLGLDTDIFDIIAAMEMPPEWLGELSGLAHDLGLAFLSSPFHPEAVELLEPHVDAFKVASYELTHEPLLRAVAATDKPVIISSGASTFEEVERAVRLLRGAGKRDLVVLQCTACYPAPLETIDAAVATEYRRRLGVLSGLSDHSLDPVAAPAAAAALGACMVEKHYTLSKDREGPDHAFAVEPEGLAALVRGVRAAERAAGRPRKRVHGVEEELRTFARRSLFLTSPVGRGEELTADNVDVLRNGKLGSGLEPRYLEAVLGARATRDLTAPAPLQAEDVDLDAEALEARAAADAPGAGAAPRAAEVTLRPAGPGDLGLIWAWANDAETRALSVDPRPIPFADHVRWFEASLASDARHLFMAERSGDPVAAVRLDAIEGGFEVSLNVDPRARGGGIGRGALDAAAAEAGRRGATRLLAHILPLNDASRRCFEASGYARDGSADPPAGSGDVRVEAFTLGLPR